MKIANYSILQDSVHRLEKSRDASESLKAWNNGGQAVDEEPSFVIDIKEQAYQYVTEKSSVTGECNTEDTADQRTESKLRLLEALVYQMTGKRVKLSIQTIKTGSSDAAAVSLPAGGVSPVQERDGWGLIYEYQETTSENESIHFNSGGTVTTSDGRKISFALEFNMSRSYFQQNNISIRLGDAAMVDPLVVVLDNGAPTLSANRQAFDLNSDGTAENIAFATQNSGFLALDRNGDGIINDGSELFGPQSGNGFAELRAFDLDNNGWIDESDDVFGRLSILSMSESGEKTMIMLGDVGIGAIYLQDVSSPFEMKSGMDEYGEMRSSSVYLRENGTAGTIHHIDLAL